MTMTTAITIEREIVPDMDHDASYYLEQEGFEDRLEQYRNGDFGFVGVRAVALINTPYGNSTIRTEMRSPGLWSIEDDSGDSYFDEVFADEKAILLDMLSSLRDATIEA
jgi:hypothetical protein